ncbi:MAG: hypothetical protein QI197_07285 [Candidatus Korarchaeota archaeon]|nr:hypothetical protein [Candidatus Korarchaeota archaeon]
MKVKLILMLGVLLLPVSAAMAAPPALWIKSYGTSGWERGMSAAPTRDNGYIVVGGYSSTGNPADRDFLAIKLDSMGNVQWSKAYDGGGEERAISVQQTSDGGYIVAGFRAGTSGDPTTRDAWIMKLDQNGGVEWEYTFDGGNNQRDEAYSVIQTSDGGYAFTGFTTLPPPLGIPVAWIVKLDETGSVEWAYEYIENSGGTMGTQIAELPDGSFAVTGVWVGTGPDYDVLFLKVSSSGSVQAAYRYGTTTANEMAFPILPLPDGYLIAGNTSAAPIGGNWDALVMKLDSDATLRWALAYGGSGEEVFTSLWPVPNGALVSGGTNSFGNGGYDSYLLKIDTTGSIVWDRTYGGTSDEGSSRSFPFNFAIAQFGATLSYGAGSFDVWGLNVDRYGLIPDCDLITDPDTETELLSLDQVDLSPSISASDIKDSISRNAPTVNVDDLTLEVNDQCQYLPVGGKLLPPMSPLEARDQAWDLIFPLALILALFLILASALLIRNRRR